MVENATFRYTAKRRQRSSVTGGGDDADETTGALAGRNTFEFAKDAGVIGIIVGVRISFVRFVSSIAGRMNAGSAVESIDFKTGVVRNDDLTGQSETVLLGFFASVVFEGEAIFDNRIQF